MDSRPSPPSLPDNNDSPKADSPKADSPKADSPKDSPKAVRNAPRLPMPQPLSNLATNPFFLISPFFLWGTAMVAMKGVMNETTPLFLAGIRLLPAGLLVVLVSVLLGREQPKGWRAWLWIGLFALIDGTLFQGFLAKGLERTGAGLGSVMIDSQPLAVAIMARFLFQEWIGPLGWLGLFVGLVGISFIGLPDEWVLTFFQGQWLNLEPVITFEQEVLSVLFQQGEWLMLMAALSMAAGTILIRYVARWADPVAATGWHMVIGGTPLIVASLVEDMGSQSAGDLPWQGLSLPGILEISYATIFGSAIAYGVFFYIAAQGNLTSLSALTFLTPVFALLFSTLLLSESLSNLQWSGVLLTLLSIYLINQRFSLADWISAKLPATFSPQIASWLSPTDIKTSSTQKATD